MKGILKGGLVVFKENIIFEECKDKVYENSLDFKKEIKKKYNIIASSDLYTRIINYQIKEYGGTLSYSHTTNREYVKHFGNRTPKNRRNGAERWKKYNEEVDFIEKVEKRNETKRTKKI